MLEINNLRFHYTNESDKQLEMDFNLRVNAGEVLSIIGSSGSGKTTLLNLIAGFIKPLSGEILLNGHDISKLDIAKRPVTTVFQEHNLFPHLDVFTNIAIGINPSLKLDKTEREQIQQALKSVGLQGLEKRLPAKLSGGQRQRVALARALVRALLKKQKILLLDEPLAALGPAMRAEIIDLIKSLVIQEKMIALFVTHQPNDALLASTKTAFIHQGKVLDVERSDIMLKQPNHQEIIDYLGQEST